LVEVSLLKLEYFEDNTSAVSIHPLVKEVAQKRLEEKETMRDAMEKVIRKLLSIYAAHAHQENMTSYSLQVHAAYHMMIQGDLGRKLKKNDDPSGYRASSLSARLLLLVRPDYADTVLDNSVNALRGLTEAFGDVHPWTHDCVRVVADALDALGRTA